MREAIMAALFAQLTKPPLVFPFTADLVLGDPALRNVSDTSQLVVGLPIFGKGIPAGAVIETLEPGPILSLPATAALTGAALTQGFQLKSRRLQYWDEVSATPALFLVEGNEAWMPRSPARPAIVKLIAESWIYTDAPANPDLPAGTAINNLIEAVDRQLQPDRFGIPQFLGLSGIAYCRIRDGENVVTRALDPVSGRALGMVEIEIAFAQGSA